MSVETVTNRKPLQWSQTGTEGVGRRGRHTLGHLSSHKRGTLSCKSPWQLLCPQNSLELGKGSGACGIELLREGERAEPGAELQEQGPGHLPRT